MMTTMIERCAMVDVHKRMVMVTVRVPGAHGERQAHTQRFDTTTAGLLTLRDWLESWRVTHVAMESTGDYWKPVYYLLEGHVQLLLVNAQHLTQVPGKKTDVSDSAWGAQLLECGLLRSSLVPPPPIRELRDLPRYRKQTIRDRNREVNRLQRVLEDAGIKLASVASDVMGASGRAIIQALVAGTTDAAVLADLAQGKLRKKLPALRAALQGRFRTHHAFLLTQILSKLETLEAIIADCSAQLEAQLAPFQDVLTPLMTIPGVKRRTAEVVIAETGADMSRFPTAAHLASWAAVCPGQDESAGKRRSGRTRHKNGYLRTALIEAASAAARTNGSALQARYRRIKARRGHQKAIVAIAHQLLTIAYAVMANHVPYTELGPDYFDQHQRDRAIRRHIRQLEQLGYRVQLEKTAA
jgi:transposase